MHTGAFVWLKQLVAYFSMLFLTKSIFKIKFVCLCFNTVLTLSLFMSLQNCFNSKLAWNCPIFTYNPILKTACKEELKTGFILLCYVMLLCYYIMFMLLICSKWQQKQNNDNNDNKTLNLMWIFMFLSSHSLYQCH